MFFVSIALNENEDMWKLNVKNRRNLTFYIECQASFEVGFSIPHASHWHFNWIVKSHNSSRVGFNKRML